MSIRNFMRVACLVALLAFTLPAWAEIQESRAIFDETYSWVTPEGAEKTLTRIKDAGFNVYIPCVWIGKGTTWPSKLAPMAPEWKNKYIGGYDPLANLIQRAHQMGIEVHPWFMVSTRWRNFFPEYYDQGTPEHAFDVHKPAFRKFIVDLMLEVVRNYDVDGINLDTIRARGMCTSTYCVNDYKAKFGRNLLNDVAAYNFMPQRLRDKTETWQYLKDWNRLAVSDIVSSFSTSARAIKPKLLISVDSIVLIEDFRVQGADSIQWSNNGWIDVIYNMDYGQEVNTRLVELARSKLKKPDSLVDLIGNVEALNTSGAYARDPQLVADLLSYTRTKWSGGNGVAMWTYQFLTDAQIEKIKNGPFKEPAKPFWKR